MIISLTNWPTFKTEKTEFHHFFYNPSCLSTGYYYETWKIFIRLENFNVVDFICVDTIKSTKNNLFFLHANIDFPKKKVIKKYHFFSFYKPINLSRKVILKHLWILTMVIARWFYDIRDHQDWSLFFVLFFVMAWEFQWKKKC